MDAASTKNMIRIASEGGSTNIGCIWSLRFVCWAMTLILLECLGFSVVLASLICHEEGFSEPR